MRAWPGPRRNPTRVVQWLPAARAWTTPVFRGPNQGQDTVKADEKFGLLAPRLGGRVRIAAEFLTRLRQSQGALQILPLGVQRHPGGVGIQRCITHFAAHFRRVDNLLCGY